MRYSGRNARELMDETIDIIFFDRIRKECCILENLNIPNKTIEVRYPDGKLETYNHTTVDRMQVVEKVSTLFENRNYTSMDKAEKELFQKVLTGLAEVVMKHNPSLSQ